MKDARLDTLRAVQPFADLDDQSLSAIAARSVERTLPRKGQLFRRGDPCLGLHVVVSGRLATYVSTSGGRVQILQWLGPGQAVTEWLVFDAGTYPASARALTDCRLLFVPAEVVEEACGRSVEALRAVIADLGGSIRRMARLVESVTLKNPRGRVAALLVEQAAARSALMDGGSFPLDATQEELAHTLAVARESVARALGALRRAGVVQQSGACIRIIDARRLMQVAELGAAPPAGRTPVGDKAL